MQISLEKVIEILEKMKDLFPPKSEEGAAILVAAQAVACEMREGVREEFRRCVEGRSTLMGIDLIQLKSWGIEIPEEYRTPEFLALESELDILIAKINKLKFSSTMCRPNG